MNTNTRAPQVKQLTRCLTVLLGTLLVPVSFDLGESQRFHV
jgi:hypothetical protein